MPYEIYKVLFYFFKNKLTGYISKIFLFLLENKFDLWSSLSHSWHLLNENDFLKIKQGKEKKKKSEKLPPSANKTKQENSPFLSNVRYQPQQQWRHMCQEGKPPLITQGDWVLQTVDSSSWNPKSETFLCYNNKILSLLLF